jgi:hypothetical protein
MPVSQNSNVPTLCSVYFLVWRTHHAQLLQAAQAEQAAQAAPALSWDSIIRVFELICVARSCLSVDELAFAADLSPSAVDRFLNEECRGIVNLTAASASAASSETQSSTVAFIHKSIRDWLVSYRHADEFPPSGRPAIRHVRLFCVNAVRVLASFHPTPPCLFLSAPLPPPDSCPSALRPCTAVSYAPASPPCAPRPTPSRSTCRCSTRTHRATMPSGRVR